MILTFEEIDIGLADLISCHCLGIHIKTLCRKISPIIKAARTTEVRAFVVNSTACKVKAVRNCPAQGQNLRRLRSRLWQPPGKQQQAVGKVLSGGLEIVCTLQILYRIVPERARFRLVGHSQGLNRFTRYLKSLEMYPHMVEFVRFNHLVIYSWKCLTAR
jgi:hypothetical protein